jgi:hypothetical protein
MAAAIMNRPWMPSFWTIQTFMHLLNDDPQDLLTIGQSSTTDDPKS